MLSKRRKSNIALNRFAVFGTRPTVYDRPSNAAARFSWTAGGTAQSGGAGFRGRSKDAGTAARLFFVGRSHEVVTRER